MSKRPSEYVGYAMYAFTQKQQVELLNKPGTVNDAMSFNLWNQNAVKSCGENDVSLYRYASRLVAGGNVISKYSKYVL